MLPCGALLCMSCMKHLLKFLIPRYLHLTFQFHVTYFVLFSFNVLFVFIKSITRSFIMLNTMMENKNTSFANISIPFLRSCSQHWIKICVFIFHHSIQHNEASGYTLYKNRICLKKLPTNTYEIIYMTI